MSTDWDVYCLDCKESYGFEDANHEDVLMQSVCRNAKQLAALSPILEAFPDSVFYLRYHRHSVSGGWFLKHANHRLIPRDEYGRCLDECGADVPCPSCHHRESCKRPMHHEGDHSPRRDDEKAGDES